LNGKAFHLSDEDIARGNFLPCHFLLLPRLGQFYYQNGDGSAITDMRTLPQFMTVQDNWLAAEAQYKNQQNVVAQAQASMNSSWYGYQQVNPIIPAPISGVMTNLAVTEGSILSSSTTGSGNGNAVQKIGMITQPDGHPQAVVSLTEIDSPKVAQGQKAT